MLLSAATLRITFVLLMSMCVCASPVVSAWEDSDDDDTTTSDDDLDVGSDDEDSDSGKRRERMEVLAFAGALSAPCDTHDQAAVACAPAEKFEFVGRHFIASYLGCDASALKNVKRLARAMHKAAEASGASVLSANEHRFPGHGFTMALLLSESHASIHTYPEHDACFVDLFTCGTTCQAERFDEVLRNYLKPKKAQTRYLLRGETA